MQTKDASDVGYGAIGGAASAVLTPLFAGVIDPQHDPLTQGQMAALGGFGTLVGGTLAGLAGANAQGGAQAGENEALNNTGNDWATRRSVDQIEQISHNPSEQEVLNDEAEAQGNVLRISPGHMPTQLEQDEGDFAIKPGGGPLPSPNVTSTSQSPTSGIDFYVNSQGTALPATGYRYMGSQYTQQTQSTMTTPLSYFGFTNYPTAAGALNGYQIDPIQFNNDATLKGAFDTLQLFGQNGFVNARVPLANGGAGPGLEPFTASYPELGSGGQAQLVPVLPGTTVQLKGVTVYQRNDRRRA